MSGGARRGDDGMAGAPCGPIDGDQKPRRALVTRAATQVTITGLSPPFTASSQVGASVPTKTPEFG